jgi:hypothetical protein
MLYDVGEDAAQCWRLEGDEWDEDEEGEEEGEEEGAAAEEEGGAEEVHTLLALCAVSCFHWRIIFYVMLHAHINLTLIVLFFFFFFFSSITNELITSKKDVMCIADATCLLDGLMTSLLNKYATKMAALPRSHQVIHTYIHYTHRTFK